MNCSKPITLAMLSLLLSVHTAANTRSTILSMEKLCSAKVSEANSVQLIQLGVECRPSANHGGALTPARLNKKANLPAEKDILSTISAYTSATKNKDATKLAGVLTEDFSIIQPGGNAWDKAAYLDKAVAHLIAMFSDVSFDIEPLRIHIHENSATVIATFRLGGLHRGKPATTFGLSTLILLKQDEGWKIQHIHSSGMQVY